MMHKVPLLVSHASKRVSTTQLFEMAAGVGSARVAAGVTAAPTAASRLLFTFRFLFVHFLLFHSIKHRPCGVVVCCRKRCAAF